MADSTSRDIELRLRARDLSTADFRSVTNSVNELSSALDKQLQAATKLEVKEKELRASLQQFDQAAKNLAGIDATLQRFKLLTEQLAKNEAELLRSKAALEAHQLALTLGTEKGKQAEQALAGYEKAVIAVEKTIVKNRESLDDYAQSLSRAGVEATNFADIERQLAASEELVGNARTKLNETILNYARYEREATEATRQKIQADKEAAAIAQTQAEAFQRLAAVQKQQVDGIRTATQQILADNQKRVDAENDLASRQKKAADDLTEYNNKNRRDQIAANLQAYADKNEANEKQVKQLQDFNARTKQLTKQRRDQETQDARETALAVVKAQEAGAKQGQSTTGNQGGQNRPTRNQQRNSLGLLPYETQNLAYQAIDVTQGLASGQNVSQIIAQQGFQILQVFPRVLSVVGKLIELLPVLAPAIAGVAVAIAAVNQAFRDIDALRNYTNNLKAISDGSNYSATALVALQHEVRELGISWSDAGKIIHNAINSGLDQTRIKEFADLALKISDSGVVTGKSVTDAFDDLVSSFSKGMEGLRQFNSVYHTFTADQLKRIQALYDEKKGSEALVVALDIITKKFADVKPGPLTDALRDLSKGWDSLMETLTNTGAIQGVVKYLSSALVAIRDMINTINAGITVLEIIDKKYPWLKYTIPGVAQGKLIGAGINSIVGPGDGQPGNPATATIPPIATTNPDGSTTATIPSQANTVVSTIMAHEGEKLRAICAALVNEALKAAGLPTSGNNLASSFKNYGTAVDPKDVRRGDIFYTDKGTEGFTGHVGVAMGPIGPDGRVQTVSSHIQGPTSNPAGVDTRNASGLIFRRPNYSGDTAGRPIINDQSDTLENAQRISKELDLQKRIKNDINAIDARNAFETEQTRKATDEIKGTSQEVLATRQKQVAAALADYDAQHYNERRTFAQQIADAKVSDGKNAQAIYDAGVKTLELEKQRYAQLGLNLSQQQANQIQLQGMEEQRKKFAQTEKQDNAEKSIDNALAQLNRANQLKDTSSLEERLKGVANQYENIRNQAKKQAEESVNTTTGGRASDFLTKVNPKIDAAETQAKALETAKYYNDRLISLTQQRTEAINAQNAAYEAGAITAQEREDAIKRAFDATTPAITATADEFQKFLSANKDLDPTKIDLYTAKLKEFRATATYISPLMKSIKDAVENSFVNGISNAFNTVAESVGNLIAKTGTFKDVLTSVKTAAANFFAGLLKDIATAIIKYEALKIASSFMSSDDKSEAVKQVANAASSSGSGSILGVIGNLFNGKSSNGSPGYAGGGPESDVVRGGSSFGGSNVSGDFGGGGSLPDVTENTKALADNTKGLSASTGVFGDAAGSFSSLGVGLGATAAALGVTAGITAILTQKQTSIGGQLTQVIIALAAFKALGAFTWGPLEALTSEGGTAAAAGGAAVAGGASSPGIIDSVGSWFGKLFHDGGIVGQTNVPSKLVDTSWFANAPRYHSGYNPIGLMPDEQAAILKNNEEVLTTDNPRHIANFRGGSQAPINIRSVLVDDPSRVHEAMSSAKGEQTIVQVLARNAPTVRQIVRG